MAGGAATRVELAPLTEEHWPAVRDVYAAGIATGHATFEAEPPTWAEFDATRSPEHRFVAVDRPAGAGGSGAPLGQVLGWVAAGTVSDRCVYAGVVEHSVYVATAARGRGVGRALLDALVTSTEAAGVWTIQSGIFPENTASLALHTAAGFRIVGTRQRIGHMSYGPLAGQWRDTVLVERRSPAIT